MNHSNTSPYNCASFYAKIAYCINRKRTPTEKVLGYMIKYQRSGYYQVRRGNRAILLQRLKISDKSYHRSIKQLIKAGLIIKRRNADDSQYHFYEISPVLNDVIAKSKGLCDAYGEEE